MKRGYAARGGTVVDARIVEAPKQRNTREENEIIKEGLRPAKWDKQPAKRAQKDIEAGWTTKRGRHYFGYKNHIAIDAKYKFIRAQAVSDAAVQDIQMLAALLPRNGNAKVYADSAFCSEALKQMLSKRGYQDRVHHRAWKCQTLSDKQARQNKTWSRVRARVEHVFGHQVSSMKQTVLRGIGVVRAMVRIGMGNLSDNLSRLVQLEVRAT